MQRYTNNEAAVRAPHASHHTSRALPAAQLPHSLPRLSLLAMETLLLREWRTDGPQ